MQIFYFGIYFFSQTKAGEERAIVEAAIEVE
jgi:hypothetical protein